MAVDEGKVTGGSEGESDVGRWKVGSGALRRKSNSPQRTDHLLNLKHVRQPRKPGNFE